MDEQLTCKSCPADIPTGTVSKICSNCHRMLRTGIKILSNVSLTLLILAGCTAGTAVVFFFIAASRGGDPSRFRVGSGRNAAAGTPAQMFIMCGFILLIAIGMFVGSEFAKRSRKGKEAEYEELVGEPFVRGTNESVF